MGTPGERAGSAHRRRPKRSSRAREDASKVFNSLTTLQGEATSSVPVVNRLHLNWQSVPPAKQARLYSPSPTVVPRSGINKLPELPSTTTSSTKQTLLPIKPSKNAALPTRKLSQSSSASLAAFEQKYAAEDPLMRYILHLIRTGSPVRRSEIPRAKRIKRKVRPEEDVLYLVHCKSPPCGFRNVYWLTFTDEGTIARNVDEAFEYFTLGSHGLTRFKGGQGIEFSDLDGWVDEKRAFDRMTSMKGLERIQQMIFFFSWKRQTVQRRLNRVRERLACSLFTCHPIAGRLLMEVRDVCAEIEREAEIEYVETNTSYTLDILAHIHRERLRIAKASITKKIHSLCVAIDDVTRSIPRYREGQGCNYATTDDEAFSKTLKLSSLSERMYTLLRLVDCHVSEAVYQHVTLVVRDLRVRICGQPIVIMDSTGSGQSVGVEERSGNLCRSELTDENTKVTLLGQTCERVTFASQVQGNDALVVAVPGLYVSLKGDVNFEGDVNSSTIHFTPAKVDVLELVHSILMQYCIAMDGLPRVLTDQHFQYVLTPFVPSVRRDFAESLLKPSHLVLESYEPDLREMRSALELHFRRIGILQQEHLRCIRAIRVAERESPVETTRRNSITSFCESDEEDVRLPELPDLSSSAVAYELAQKTWNRFTQYANNAAPMLQVGYLLLDQHSFVERLRRHVSKRVAEMDDTLPLIYQKFLAGLLKDVDGRIENVTKIPTNLTEANMWLTQVTSMMPTHPFRQRLDTKIDNLARLRELMKERGLISLESEIQDSIRKLELTWGSVIETLLMCLARVEERGSEHRRSVQDVITKAEEYITGEMQLIIKTFEELPSGCEAKDDEDDGIPNNKSSHAENSTKEDMVQQLEDLVVMDVERKHVVQQFEEYDREHHAIMDLPPTQHAVWMSSHSNSDSLSAVSLADKLPSELLLLYIITALELRQWFESWKKLQEKWLGTPLTGVHPGTMINRIKQFRRRLVYASSRLSRLSSVLLEMLPMEQNAQNIDQYDNEDREQCAYFAKKDFELMRVFDSSIEEMLNCNRIFQAITGGAFSEARWAAMNQLLNVHVGPKGTGGGGHLTLRLMKDKCNVDQIEAFLGVCDECIVEAKLHVKLEQVRQRLARIELRVEEANYSVRCEGVAEALAQLDEIAVDLKLCLFGQNPELQLCLELRVDLERKVAVCEHILSYQKHWRLRCEASKLHEVDEFFSKRFSGGSDSALPRARKSQHKAGLKQEQLVWQAFLDASHAWSDRLRRLFFVSPQQPKVEPMKTNPRSLLGRKSAVATASATPAPMTLHRRLTKSMDCTLDNVMESFESFDFETNFAACERGIELVQNYLESLREKSPRMYCLDDTSMFRLLLRDSDMKQLHQSLSICFPRIHRFAITRAANRVGSTIEVFGKPETASPDVPARTSKTNGTIVIMGIEGMYNNASTLEKSGHFRLPVAKIGRVTFWFTRLEEEMSSMVQTDLKRALEWATHDFDSSEYAAYDSLLPQSIVTACGLQFTFEMNRALRSDQHEAMCHQLHQLHVNFRNRVDGLVATRHAGKTACSRVRLENMIVLSAMQSEVCSHITELIEQGQKEDAMFFWRMQFQTRAFLEIISTPGSSLQPSSGKHSKVERNELLPTSSDFLKVSFSNHSGQSISMLVCCQVAHLQIPLGQEFVGWGRMTVVSPFTQRCSYALFSALRMHHTPLVVPYNGYRAGTDPTSCLWSISQMLLRPCIEFSCDLSAGATTTHHLGNLMSAISKLNGFLIVRHLLQLSAALVGVVQERMLQHFHQAAPVGNFNVHHQQHQIVTNSLVLSRYPGGQFYGASAIFVPLDTTEDLQHSKLVRSIRTQFRAVAVSRPDIKFVIECMLIGDGFVGEQIREINVVQAFEAIDTGEAGVCALNMELLISRVFQEAHRLHEHYRVVWDTSPLTRGGSALFQKRQSNSHIPALEIREGQCVFRQAFHSAITTMLNEQQVGHGDDVAMEHVNTLLACLFPLSFGGRLVTKKKGDEEAVAAAVSIYLESAYALPTDCEQFEVIMELWRALQTFPAALVYGSPGSGKTTCITALHRALMALELSEQSQENEEVGCSTSKTNPPSSLTQLVILNPQLLSLDQFYSSVAAACGAGDSSDITWKTRTSSLKWVLVDGEIDSGILDRLLESDNRACSSASSLPSSSILYRGQSSSVLSGDCSDPSDSPRLLFEVPTLANLSPSTLRRCWALHIPTHCITVASIIGSWRSRWESQLIFPPDSRGFEAMAAVFRTVDVLMAICLRFVVEETSQDQVTDAGDVVNSGELRLGCLTLNRITQTALTLVSFCCFQNKSLLHELSYLRLVELVAFAVLWGFGGHLPDPCKHKLENYVRKKSKEHSETKHLAELPRGLLEGNHFEDVWDGLQPRFATPITAQTTTGITHGAKPEAKIQSAVDSISGQVLVLIPAATSLIRICTMLLHSSHSFLLIGPPASGKTSLLRWLMHRNREAEAAEMKIETSLDKRHVHGILDWTGMPAAWFHPLDQQDEGSRAKMREEAELFAGRSRHSFVFLDDLDASGAIADKIQMQFVRTMLDHRIGYSTKHGGFQRMEKQIGAVMRFDGSGTSIPLTLERFMRHFIVFRVPTYTQKELLSVFRVRFQQHFEAELSQSNIERRLSTKGDMGGGGQQLPLEEVILRATVDFAVEMTALQQLGHTEHPCLYLFNLHHMNMLLEKTLIFATDISASTNAASEGTTLVQLGKAHQCWLSELQNIFLSNCPMEISVASSQVVKVGTGGDTSGEDTQQKISTLLRHLSEKYFSVAFRGRPDHSIPTSVESLYFLVKLAEHHVLAPLLQPRLVQLRELLNEHMTSANGVSRRSSDQARGVSSGGHSTVPAIELVSRVLMEIAATSTSWDAAIGLDKKASRPYSSGQLTAYEMKLLLSSSWCLTQAMHLVHALSQQQQVIVSSTSRHTWLLSDRLLRFVCDLHGFKVHTIQDDNGEDMTDQHKRALRAVLGAAGVRQERVALWIRERQVSSDRNSPHTSYLLDTTKELCLGKFPSLALLPGGQELRDELVLSCIQSRKQLEIVTEAELMAELQQRIQKNFRLCILEDGQFVDEEERAYASPFIRWMKTRPSCHWRRLDFSEFELQRLIPEVARAALTSPPLCDVGWDIQQVAKYVTLCQNVHSLMMRSSPIAVDPTSQLDYFLSFMTNVTVKYRVKLQCHQKKVVRLENTLKTLTFVRDKVVPTLERLQRNFELQCSQVDSELESITLEQLPTKQQDSNPVEESGVPVNEAPNVDPDVEEARWILQARHEELMMTSCETNLRLEQVSRFLAEWHHVTERMNELFMKWTQELDQEKCKTEHEIMGVAMHECAQRAFAHVTSLGMAKRNEYRSLLGELVLKNIVAESSPGIERRLMNTPIDGDIGDGSAGITRLIWSSRFSFLRNPDIYRTLRLADELCDRVPVIVDPSGVLQRFLVHTFSGHTLFSTLPGCGGAGEAESEHPNSTKESMVISCDDPKLEHYLQEALRLGIPVLLVNFRSGDSVLLDRLQPFLDQARLSHSPSRRPMLHELTLKYYEDQRKHKQKRTSITSSAMAAMSLLTQTATIVGDAAISMPKRAVRAGKHKAMSIDPVSVAAAVSASTTLSPASCDVAKTPGPRDTSSKLPTSIGNMGNGRNFQIYAVTTTPVPLELQHALAAQFAHFAVSIPDFELKTLFELPCVGKTQQNLLQELRGDQVGLADCWMKLNQNRDQLDQLLVALIPATVDESPFAARRAKQGVTIQLQERYSELALQVAKEYQAELIWSSRLQNLQVMYSKLDNAATVFDPIASRLVGVARCMATMSSSLTIGTRKSPFYLQSIRYLENAAAQQLSVQGDDNMELSHRGLTALITRISSGFVSDSHRQIFSFLVSIQQVQTRRPSIHDEVQFSPWYEAIIWLTTSRIRKARLKNSSSLDLLDPSDEKRQGLGSFAGRWNSQRWPGDSGISLVERLRRRVKLCAYLFNGWKASEYSKNARGKQLKAPRILVDGSTADGMQKSGSLGKTASSASENEELAMEQLQQNLDKLLADSETLWYEWKTTRVRLQLDMEQLFNDMGYEDASILSSTERNNAIFPTAITLISLEELSARYKADTVPDDEMSTWQHALVRLLLAKTLFASSFAQVLMHYLQLYGVHASEIKLRKLESKDDDGARSDELWTSWSSPASLVVDIAPSRGKHSRAHLPRALIVYMPDERSRVELKLSVWDIAVFVDTSADNVTFREELIMLITTKHRFVLELVDAKQAEPALSLVSQLINEHALLSVPEWYMLASFAVATTIENGKLAVMDRIVVCPSSNLSQLDFVDRDRVHTRTTEQNIKHKLVEECGASSSMASDLTLAVLMNHGRSRSEQEVKSSVIKDLEDVVLHFSSVEEVAVDVDEREQMTKTLLRLLTKTDTHDSSGSSQIDAARSSEFLNDLLSVGDSSLAMLTEEPEGEWLARYSPTDGGASCERLWTIFCLIADLFKSLQAANRFLTDSNTAEIEMKEFFPWQSLEFELTNQLSAFEAIHKHLTLLRVSPTTASSHASNRQQQLASLARGYVPFEWAESFFAGTAWPAGASGTVSMGQILLLIACRVGVLVRCLRGDRAWALNLAVVSDACKFLQCLRTYTAERTGIPESSLLLILELDSSTDSTDAKNEEDEKKKTLAIVKKLGVLCSGDNCESDWHGAVVHHIDGGIESWGIRVEGLVLVQQASITKLHPLPLCRITCQLCIETTSQIEAPVVLLPSLSPYQSPPTISHDPDIDNSVRVVLGRSINSVIDMGNDSATNETTQYGVGIPVFPDDDSHESS